MTAPAMFALPPSTAPPPGSSPPTGGVGPPGPQAPPGGSSFHSALAEHWARTAHAEGQQQRSPQAQTGTASSRHHRRHEGAASAHDADGAQAPSIGVAAEQAPLASTDVQTPLVVGQEVASSAPQPGESTAPSPASAPSDSGELVALAQSGPSTAQALPSAAQTVPSAEALSSDQSLSALDGAAVQGTPAQAVAETDESASAGVQVPVPAAADPGALAQTAQAGASTGVAGVPASRIPAATGIGVAAVPHAPEAPPTTGVASASLDGTTAPTTTATSAPSESSQVTGTPTGIQPGEVTTAGAAQATQAPEQGPAVVAQATSATASSTPPHADQASGQEATTGATATTGVAPAASTAQGTGQRDTPDTSQSRSDSPAGAANADTVSSPAAESVMTGASIGLAGVSAPATGAPGAPGAAQAAGVDLQQMIESVHATIELAARQGSTQARIALAPPELGELRIHLSQTAAGLLARITADSAAGAQALSEGRAELHQSLSSLGVSLLRLDIGSFGPSEGGGQNGAFDASPQRSNASRDEDGEAPITHTVGESDDTTVPGSPAGSALVDVLA